MRKPINTQGTEYSRNALPNQVRFLRAAELSNQTYPLPVYFRFSGKIDRGRFRGAIEALIRRYPVLATHFTPIDGGYRVVAGERPRPEFLNADLSSDADAWATATSSPFNLWTGPLFRAGVINPDGPEGILWISVDHSIADGTSLTILIDQLANSYNNDARTTNPGTLQDQDDQAIWSTQTIESHSGYWSAWPGRSLECLTIPAAPGRTPAGTTRKSSVEHLYPRELVNAVSAASRSIGASTFSAFSFASSLVLGRWASLNSGVLAFQSSGRHGVERADERVGLYSNVLLLKADLTPERTVAENIASLHAFTRDAIAHERAPFDEILISTGLRPRVDLNWYPFPPPPKIEGTTQLEQFFPTNWSSDFDANFYFYRSEKGVLLRLLFDDMLYDSGRMLAIAEQIQEVLRRFVEQPDWPTGALEIASAAHLKQPKPHRRAERINSKFEHHADQTPDGVAVVTGSRSWTYAELNQAANDVAYGLEESGVQPGERVAVLATRVPSIVSACLGAAKLGAPFCIIDADYPGTRVQRMLDMLDPKAVITCGQIMLDPDVQQTIRTIGSLMALPADIQTHSSTPATIRDRAGDDGVAYLLFTSGTTGKPKCIEVGHPPLVNFVEWQTRTFDLSPDDRFAAVAGLSHDPFLRDIFSPLSNNATLVFPPAGDVSDPEAIVAFMHQAEITRAHLTPQLGEFIVSGAGFSNTTLDRLRTVFWGGDRLRAAGVSAFRSIAKNAQQVNFYGTSETPQAALAFTIPEHPSGDIPLGAPVEGWQVDIIRDDGSTAGIGESGEIRLRSPLLSLGYIDGDTNERFTQIDGQPAYRTGDFGRVTPQGVVEFLGRRDDQVKVRGFRVGLGEVAANIAALPGVDHAVARAIDSPTGLQIAAYVKASSAETQLTPSALRGAVSSLMPAYMTPTFYVIVEDWPLTPNGKIDFAALPAPTTSDRPNISENGAQSKTKLERELAEAWAEVIGVESVSVNESFASLGGDSMSAIRLIGHLGKKGIDRSAVQGLLQGRTIREIAQAIGSDNSPGSKAPPALFAGSAVYSGSINVLRALLVCLLIIGHWLPGLLERLPEQYASIRTTLTPVLNAATPGFAFIFGVTVGFSMFPRFRSSPRAVLRSAGFGTLLVGSGLVTLAAIEIGLRIFHDETVSTLDVANSFYNVLAYYFLAMLTLPAWLWLISRWGKPVIAALVVAALSYAGYKVAAALPIQDQLNSLFEWPRLMLVAKFNYFAMSAGALFGVAIGIHLAKSAATEKPIRFYGFLGLAIAAAGMLLSFLDHSAESWTSATRKLLAWKWLFYSGVVIASFPIVGLTVRWLGQGPTKTRVLIALLASAGQCALPVFVFHHLVLDAKNIADALGWPDLPALVAVLIVFAIGCAAMITQVFQLFYSKLIV